MTTDYISEYNDHMSGKRKRYHGANVRFRLDAVEDVLASEKAGRPIFRDIEVIEVRYPGEGANVLEVTDKHKAEYSELYAAFKSGQEQATTGTPLEQWPLITKAYCEEFKALGLRTVEQLAEANDNVRAKMKGNYKYIKEAKEWLQNANSNQNQLLVEKKENEKLRARISALEDNVAALLMRIDATEGTNFSSEIRKSKKATNDDKNGN